MKQLKLIGRKHPKQSRIGSIKNYDARVIQFEFERLNRKGEFKSIFRLLSIKLKRTLT